MAIALIQNPFASQGSGSPSQTLLLSQLSTAGNLMVVLATTSRNGQSATVSGVTDNAIGGSSVYVQAPNAQAQENSVNNSRIVSDIWYCDSVKAGASQIVVAFNNGTNSRLTTGVGALEYSGTQVPSFEIAGGSIGTTTPATGGSVTTVGTSDVIVSICGVAAGTVNSVASPFTTRGVATHMMADNQNVVSGTYAPIWTLSAANRWCSSTAAFTALGSSIAGSTRTNLMRVGN